MPSPLGVHPLSAASLHALFWADVTSLLLSRALYRTPDGGDGDDARHLLGAPLTIAAPSDDSLHMSQYSDRRSGPFMVDCLRFVLFSEMATKKPTIGCGESSSVLSGVDIHCFGYTQSLFATSQFVSRFDHHSGHSIQGIDHLALGVVGISQPAALCVFDCIGWLLMGNGLTRIRWYHVLVHAASTLGARTPFAIRRSG